MHSQLNHSLVSVSLSIGGKRETDGNENGNGMETNASSLCKNGNGEETNNGNDGTDFSLLVSKLQNSCIMKTRPTTPPCNIPPCAQEAHHALRISSKGHDGTPARKIKQSRGDKTPKIEIESRVAKVADLILEGASRYQIVRFCSEKFNVCDDTADSYIVEARKEWHEMLLPEKRENLTKALLRFESLYSKCMEIQDYRGAATMQDRICKLLGLYPNEDDLKHKEPLTIEIRKLW